MCVSPVFPAEAHEGRWRESLSLRNQGAPAASAEEELLGVGEPGRR